MYLEFGDGKIGPSEKTTTSLCYILDTLLRHLGDLNDPLLEQEIGILSKKYKSRWENMSKKSQEDAYQWLINTLKKELKS